ncbi:MAG: hypothetical protein HYS13_12845 [Planctomycetia bacterium]|nr:hypothetical protein [Planctomycetia bacterium]
MSIRDEPHYELASRELAGWIAAQGADTWWTVDGDHFLTGRLAFPCPGDELATELRSIDRPLLVRSNDPSARGQALGRESLDPHVTRLGDNLQMTGQRPLWTENRVLFLSWKGSNEDWLLVEDKETSESSSEDAAAVERKS